MKSIAQITIPKLPLLGAAAAAPEDARVLELFRNRAELKKAYSELQDEIHALKDRLKQQEGVTAQVQEMLADLERKLELPESAYAVLVFYRLRNLWNCGNRLLAQVADDLHNQLTEKESKLFVAESNRLRFEQRRALDADLQKTLAVAADAELKLADFEAQRTRLARPWHYFKRKDLEERIKLSSKLVQAARADIEPAREAFAQFEQHGQLPFPGISVDAKRAINTATIAFAELLCLRLAKSSLLGLAKAASLKRGSGDAYGTRAECEALIEDIGRAIAILGQRTPTGAELKARAERLRKIAKYRAADDCIPLADSLSLPLGDLDVIEPRPRSEPPIPNVVAEDTWDVLKILLR
jgi:hypothetical protein